MKTEQEDQQAQQSPMAAAGQARGGRDYSHGDDDVYLRDLWRMLSNYKGMIALVVLASSVLFTVSAFVMTPVYRADVLLVPSSSGNASGRYSGLVSQFGGLADIAGISGGNSDGVATPIAILKSRKFITSFIEEFRLKPVLFKSRWNEQKKAWIVREPSLLSKMKKMVLPGSRKASTTYKPGEPTNEQVYNMFKGGMLGITQDSKTKLVTLGIEWHDPVQAAEWANALVKKLNESLRQRSIDEAQRSIDYLEEQIRQTSIAELRNVLYRLIEEHTKNITLAKVNDEYAMKVIDPAIPPEAISSPKRKLIVILGVIFGLMLGIFLAFVMSAFRKVRRV